MLKQVKKYLCAALSAVTVAATCFGPAYAHGSAAAAETSFMEDFESYQTVINYHDKTAKDYITNAKPKDGDYSDTAVYPNGTASVYEGNAMNNVAVKDAKGNDVYGGLDGWYGYYNGVSASYNQYNRRLTVGAYSGKADRVARVNASHTLRFEPHKNSSAIAALNRNFVDLSGYSFLSSRISLSSGTDNFGKAGISITQNPQNAVNASKTDTVYSAVTELVTFEGNDDGTISVKFNGSTVKADLPKSVFQDANTANTWYTVELRLYSNGNSQKANFYMIEDSTGAVIANTGWVDFALNDGFVLNGENTYGIRFYARSTKDVAQPRMLLDDVKFTKDNFAEDFEKYNIKTSIDSNAGNSAPIRNGAFGNLNDTDIYADGVYEGNLTKNNYVYNSLGEKVYGNVPFWQGYLSNVGGQDVYNPYNRRCTIDQISWYAPMNTKMIRLEPKSVKGASHAAYAGMESSDFSDGTIWKTTVSFPEKAANKGVFKLQLTKGYSITDANGDNVNAPNTKYDGNSHAAYFDVLTFENGEIFFEDGTAPVGTYGYKRQNVYEITYTVDRTNGAPKSSVKIVNKVSGEKVYESEPAVMNLTDGFSFDSNITGFRYCAVTDTCDESTAVQIKAYIDDVSISKFFGGNVCEGFRSIVIDKASNSVSGVLNLNKAASMSVICAVYSKENMQLAALKSVSGDFSAGDNSISIPIELPADYSDANYTVKLLRWGSMATLKPLAGVLSTSKDEDKENFHIYLCIGQSNMAGRAPIEDADLSGYDNVYLFNQNNNWEAAAFGTYNGKLQGFNRYSTTESADKTNGLSPASTFAKKIASENSGIKVGIVSNARGGTSIDEWLKGAESGYYEATLSRVKEAMKYGTLKGILWHQGESDQATKDTYMSRLQTLINDLRTDLGISDLPFVAGQLLPKYTEFNEMILTLPDNVANTACVLSEGTADKGDDLHFDAASARLMGERYAEKITEAVYR